MEFKTITLLNLACLCNLLTFKGHIQSLEYVFITKGSYEIIKTIVFSVNIRMLISVEGQFSWSGGNSKP